jgi:protein-S-isoprenylcysteine O-methyltransferase Ste14
MNDKVDRAQIIAPPPLLGAACIALGFMAHHFKRLPLFAGARAIQIAIGVGLFVFAGTIIFLARQQFLAHGTHPNPYRPTAAIVSSGVYRFSRNPIYIAFLLIVLGFAFCANSMWFLLSAGILFVLLHLGVIKREERYLSHRFGETYQAYCRRVRRWI